MARSNSANGRALRDLIGFLGQMKAKGVDLYLQSAGLGYVEIEFVGGIANVVDLGAQAKATGQRRSDVGNGMDSLVEIEGNEEVGRHGVIRRRSGSGRRGRAVPFPISCAQAGLTCPEGYCFRCAHRRVFAKEPAHQMAIRSGSQRLLRSRALAHRFRTLGIQTRGSLGRNHERSCPAAA
jgi:hypothetical protein